MLSLWAGLLSELLADRFYSQEAVTSPEVDRKADGTGAIGHAALTPELI